MSARRMRKQGHSWFLAVAAADLQSGGMATRRAAWLLLLTSCATPGARAVGDLLSEAQADGEPRITIDGGAVVTVASPVDYRALPAAARQTCEALAPDGALVFCGVERGARGEGYRVEKRYEAPVPHRRSVLVDGDGAVLERSHTLPTSDAPQEILAAALRYGSFVQEVEIISGPTREEGWRVLVSDRRGRAFSVALDLYGRLVGLRRRTRARVDAAPDRGRDPDRGRN